MDNKQIQKLLRSGKVIDKDLTVIIRGIQEVLDKYEILQEDLMDMNDIELEQQVMDNLRDVCDILQDCLEVIDKPDTEQRIRDCLYGYRD